ncbi:MAG: SdrD B-like domain-containing protein [Tepidisphaeraceae bacterium]
MIESLEGRVLLAVPPVPVIVSPGDVSGPGPVLDSTIPESFTWNTSTGATSYGFRIINVATGFTAYSNTVTGTSYSLPANTLGNGTTYDWYMYAVNGSGNSANSPALYFQTIPLGTPTIISPGDVSPGPVLDSTLAQTFTWTAVPRATTYGLRIVNAAGGIGSVYSATVTGTSCSVPANTLGNGGSYDWYLYAINGSGNSADSVALYFQTLSLGTPTIISPGDVSPGPVLDSTLAQTFSWNAVPRATSYGLSIVNAAGGIGSVYSATVTGTSCSVPANTLGNGGSYDWYMYAINGSGNSADSAALYFQTLPLGTPTIISPGDVSPGPVLDSTIAQPFTWSAVPRATSYGLRIVNAAGGIGSVYSATVTGTSCSVPANTLGNGGSYDWYMYAINGSGNSADSAALYFQTLPIDTPTIVSPGDVSPSGPSFAANQPLAFSWNAVSRATSYGLHIHNMADTYGFNDKNYTVTGTSYTLAANTLSNGLAYDWYIYAINGSGDSANSSVLYFQTVPLPPPAITSPGSTTPSGPMIDTYSAQSFAWSNVTGATKYGLYIYDISAGAMGYSNTTLTGTPFSLPADTLQPGHAFDWYMTSFNGSGETVASSPLYFQTPILATPTTASPGNTTSPGPALSATSAQTFSWTAVSGATHYGLYIEDLGTSTTVYSSTTLTGTSYSLPANTLANGDSYSWTLTAINNAGTSPESVARYFTTTALATPTTTSPGTTTPAGPVLSPTTAQTFSWSAVTGATSYGLYIRDVATGTTVFSRTTLTGTSFSLPANTLGNGYSYVWTLTAINGAGPSAESAARYFQTPALAIPTITSPGDPTPPGPTLAATSAQTLSWSPVTGISRFALTIRDTSINAVVYTLNTLTGTSFSLPANALGNGHAYSWTLASVNSAGAGAESSPRYFQTSALAAPVPASPGDASPSGPVLTADQPHLFTWSSVAGATSYALYILDASTSTTVYSNTSLTGTSLSLPANSIQYGNTYYWFMTSANGAGSGGNSSPLYFQTTTPPTPTVNTPGEATAPGDVRAADSAQTFTWISVSGATQYRLQVFDITTNLQVYSNATINTSIIVSSGTFGTGDSFRWSVTSINGAGESGPSDYNYFQTVAPPAPVINLPAEAAAPGDVQAADIAQTFTWNIVSGATSYGVYIYDLTLNELVYSSTSVNASISVSANTLANGDAFRWWVTGINSAGESAPSAYYYFQTITPGAPTTTSPGSLSSPGNTITGQTAVFSWNVISGASRYGLYIWDTATDQLVYSNLTITATSFSNPAGSLQLGHSYRWAVTGINGAGESAPAAYRYFQTPAPVPPNVPTTNFPGLSTLPAGQVTSLTPTFSWNSATNAATYGLYIIDTSSGQQVYSNVNLTGTSFILPALTLAYSHTYRWFMVAFSDAAVSSNPSTDRYFVTPDPSVPSAVFASSGSLLEGSPITISFSSQSDTYPADAAAGYVYSYDLNGDGVYEIADVPNASWQVTFPDEGAYTVGGRIKDADGHTASYTLQLVVGDVPPTIALSGGNSVNAGAAYTLTLGAVTEAGTDTVTQYIVDWGDGTTPDTFDSAGDKSHVYATAGTRQILVSLVDGDGTHAAAGTHSVQVLPNTIARIAGRLFNDTNANGRLDPGEKPIAGKTVFLDANGNGVFNTGELKTVTNAAGNYVFLNVPVGHYAVLPLPVTGMRLSKPAAQAALPILAAGSSVVNWNLGLTARPLITGIVFNDANHNGKLDVGETGIANARVYLDIDNNHAFSSGDISVLTDANGNFSLLPLKPGKYTLRVVTPAGRTMTLPASGSYTFTIRAGQTISNRNFGLRH